LLERIREEKKRLVKDGKLKKKDLKETPINEDEIPFDIPDSWEWVKFGDLVSTSTGKTPARGNTDFWGNDYPWVSISDMKQGEIIKSTKECISQKAANDCFHNVISTKGTLIMSFKLTVGRTSILGIDAYHNEAIISIKTYADKDNITRNYLAIMLPIIANSGDSKDAIKGKTLNSTSIYNLLVPLPPLAEQKRIVAKIEEVFKEIDKLQK
jgi:type I restriction enzyme S subunit